MLCQQRKVRCDKNKPCANCVKAGVECRVVPPQPPRRRKKRLQERELVDRLKKYETLLAENGVKFDAIGHDLRADGPHNEDVDELENDFEGLKTTSETTTSPSATSHIDRYVLPLFCLKHRTQVLHSDCLRNRPGRSIFALHREVRNPDTSKYQCQC